MRIENYREQPVKGSVVAMFDVYLDKIGLSLRNLKLVNSKKGHRFIAYPSFAIEHPGEEKKWTPYFAFSEERKKEFEAKLLQELTVFAKQNQSHF